MDSAEVNTVKGGENVIQTTLSRVDGGIKVNVWMLPRVEEFMRSLGNGEKIRVDMIGRHWTSSRHKDLAMFVYNLNEDLGLLSVGEKFTYRLDKPGHPLTLEQSEAGMEGGRRYGSPNESLNLSFLRLVGSSESGGIGFIVNGVYGRPAMDKLAERIDEGVKRFYREFLKPYKVVISTSIMQIPESY